MVNSLGLVQLPMKPPEEENATKPLVNSGLFYFWILFTLLAGLLRWGMIPGKRKPLQVPVVPSEVFFGFRLKHSYESYGQSILL